MNDVLFMDRYAGYSINWADETSRCEEKLDSAFERAMAGKGLCQRDRDIAAAKGYGVFETLCSNMETPWLAKKQAVEAVKKEAETLSQSGRLIYVLRRILTGGDSRKVGIPALWVYWFLFGLVFVLPLIRYEYFGVNAISILPTMTWVMASLFGVVGVVSVLTGSRLMLFISSMLSVGSLWLMAHTIMVWLPSINL